MATQVYQCNTKACRNETRHAMPNVNWLQMDVIECEKCGRLIVFSTLYPPKALVGGFAKLP